MKNPKFLPMEDRKKWCFLMLFALIFAQVNLSDADQTPPVPAAGLLCISDCASCPVICSPPPSPPVTSKPPQSPPVLFPSPPKPRSPPHYYSPSQPYFRPPPSPSLFPIPLPPEASPPPPPTPPPPSYISWGNTAPPPPSGYFGGGGGNNVPTIIQVPPGMGQRNYSYPYYYFYASKAPSSFTSSQKISIFVFFMAIQAFFCFS